MSRIALVIAAHPDDEVLGCGGTIARLTAEEWKVHILILAEGATSRDRSRNRANRLSELSALAKAAHAANAVLGAASVTLGDLPDNRMDTVALLDVVKIVEDAIAQYRPELVFAHHAGDLNVDHRVLHEAAITACRPMPQQSVRELLFFEVASSTEWRPASSGLSFVPALYYDIGDYLETKLRALDAYESEMRPFPHARSIEAQRAMAMWRGATVGLPAAEAFAVGRLLR